MGKIADQIFQAVHEARAAGVDKALQGGGVAAEPIGRRHCVYHERNDKAHAFRIALVHFRLVHEAVERRAPGEVALRERPIGKAFLPGRIGETLILGVGHKLGTAGQDAAEFAEKR